MFPSRLGRFFSALKKEWLGGNGMYQKVSTDMDFVSREKKVLEFWKREGIIEKSFHNNEGHERFTFPKSVNIARYLLRIALVLLLLAAGIEHADQGADTILRQE